MIKRLHFRLELFFYYLRKYSLFLLIGTLLGSLAYYNKNRILGSYHQLTPIVKIIGIDGLYNQRNISPEISDLISYGLTSNSDNDKPIPSPLVEQIDTLNDNQTYIFHLKKDLFWHNGLPFQSHDIVYNIKGLTLKYIDASTLEIHLSTPFAPILSVLSQPLFYKSTLIGLGPYRVTKIKYQDGNFQTMILKSTQDQPQLTYKFFNSENDLITAFKLGQIDEMSTTSLPEEFNLWPNLNVTPQINTYKQYSAIFINTEKLNNKQFRQSLAYATPKTKDKNERCLSPISPNSWAYNPAVKEYGFNPERAKELAQDNTVTQLTLSVGDRRLLPLAETIKNSWKEVLNIDTTIIAENQVSSQDFDALLTFGIIPHDPDQYLFWHSTQESTNLTKLNNSRIDKLLEDGRTTFDYQERKKIYHDFQRYLLEESPAIFLSYPTTYTINRLK